MKTQLTVIVFLLGFFCNAFAKSDKQERMNELLQKRTEYISSKIGLTPEENVKFISLYNEFQQKRMELFKKNDIGMRKKKENKNSFTEQDYQKINEAYINEKLNKATLDRVYYEKFKEILPESKIFAMFQAERLYRQDLIKQVENKGKRKGKTKTTPTNK
ncbi:MAG: hypothetical protein LBR52_00995 [Prevotellaceae bacterium]|nr:hypothetical protein [Prevotellaceae bacterium]